MNNKVIELSAYTLPKIVEDKKGEWVNYGEDNNYYQFLIDRYVNSTTNNAIINNIVKLIYGDGLTSADASRKPEMWANLLSIISAEDLRKVIFDLYALGQASFQVHYSKNHKQIVKAFHLPEILLRPEKCNKDGEIEGYYYSDNWQDVKKFPPKRFSKFGTSNDEIEILRIQPYSVGLKYFSYVDYQGGLDYALLEEKISEYLINEVTNSFSPTTIINFNNGQPTDEQKDDITNRITSQLTGSTGKKLVVSFNDNETTKTTIDSVQLNNAPEHYQYLSDEARTKIMLSHNVTSPLIFGIATTTGFSSNSEELQNSFALYMNMVIKPKQQLIIAAINQILNFNGVSLQLGFKSLNPFKNDALVQDNKAAQILNSLNSLSPLVANKVLDSMNEAEIRNLVGLSGPTNLGKHVTIDDLDIEKFAIEEDLSDYELVYCEEVDYDNESSLNAYLDDLEQRINKSKPLLQKLAKKIKQVNTGVARGNIKSDDDNEMFKSRYRYVGDTSEKSRLFCKKMTAANKLYRWEDILRMDNSVVNEGWGPEGADTYKISLYKGGGNCHHKWQREIYMKKSDVNSPLAKEITTGQARKNGYIPPVKDKKVWQRPIDMPNNGFLPKNK